MRFGWEGGKRRTPGAQASGKRPWCPCWSQSGARPVSRSSRPTPEPPASLRGAAWKPARYSTAQQHTRDGGRCRRSYRRQRSRADEEGTRRQRGRGRVARARTAAWTARTPLAASSQRFGARSAAARWWSGGPVPDAWARGYGDRWATVGPRLSVSPTPERALGVGPGRQSLRRLTAWKPKDKWDTDGPRLSVSYASAQREDVPWEFRWNFTELN
jgi:hypothetical protein